MQNSLFINPEQEKEKIVNFLKKNFKEQKIDKVVLGLSGGIDSTTALYLLKEALPVKNIYAVQMDYFPRKKLDIDLKGINVVNVSIKKIVDEFEKNILKAKIPFLRQSPGVPFGVWRSKKTVSSFKVMGSTSNFFSSSGNPPPSGESQVAKKLVSSPSLNKIRLGNIMARVRMIILFDLAKQLKAMVCGTENKSERLLGYFTRFGDAASDIEPISHLYKTQIRQLADYLKVSEEIINQFPTAGLWDRQTDEDDFGFTYEEADQVLYLLHKRGQDINKVKKDFPNAEKIIKRFQNNQFKLKTPYSLK